MPRLPLLLALSAIAILTVMDALIKSVSPRYPTFEIAFLRFAFGSVIAGFVFLVARPGLPSMATVTANASRALLVVATATSFFYALGQLPLAETITLSFMAPIFVALLGAIFLKEHVGGRIIAALAAGFAGMIVIVAGQMGADFGFRGPFWGIVAALASAVTYAASLVVLRARAQRDPAVTIVLIQNIAPALLIAPAAWWVWTPPSAPDLALMALIGGLGTAGHLLLANAFARAPAARLASLDYTALVWASLIGFFAFGEVPTLATLVGGAMIVAGAMIAARR